MAATSDTLALAAEERAKQGIHELEISFGGELDLHKHLNDCVKNPGHRKFIPIRKLTKCHISEYKCPSKFLEWVRHMSRYTVKLSVKYVSPNRPPGYPLSGRGGRRLLTVGSGYVSDLPPRGNNKMPCPFKNCGELPGDHEVCGYFTVVTAAHVVHDDEEAKNTTVDFFDDDPDDRSGVMTARGVKVAAFSAEGDFCELLCVTHDASLLQRLNEPQISMPYFKFEICVNCASCNRSTGLRSTSHPYPLSDLAKPRVLYVGIECVRAFPSAGNNSRLQYPFETYHELPEDYEVDGDIVVTTNVCGDEEAENAALEFFYGDPGSIIRETRGVKGRAYRVHEDSCKLQDYMPERVYSLRKIGELSGRRICGLFQTLLPGIDNIVCTSGLYFQFLVKIKLSNLSEALQSMALLQLFTVEAVHHLLNMSTFGYYSSHDLLKLTSFHVADILHLIKYELRIAAFIDRVRQTTAFSHLLEKLTDLHRTLRNPDAESTKNHWLDFLSITSELAQFYCTVERLGKRFSPTDFPPECIILNRQKAVSISKYTATVNITILRRHEREAIRGYKDTSLDPRSLCDYRSSESDSETTKCLNKRKPTAKEFNPSEMFLVHIAHPHGQSKQVTIGRQTNCLTGDGFYKQLYTAPTCPGCSGGPVWMIPASGDLSEVYGVPHHGHHGNELNSGCSWTMYPHEFKL